MALWGRGSRILLVKSDVRVGFGYIYGYKIMSMPYPRVIRSGLGAAHGRSPWAQNHIQTLSIRVELPSLHTTHIEHVARVTSVPC